METIKIAMRECVKAPTTMRSPPASANRVCPPSNEMQIQLLETLNGELTSLSSPIVRRARTFSDPLLYMMCSKISKKLSAYKRQDICRKRGIKAKQTVIYMLGNDDSDERMCADIDTDIDEQTFCENISVLETIRLLLSQKLLCAYCSQPMAVLYAVRRAHNQWTLDRVDNDGDHTRDNVVAACMACNLKRRTKPSDTFKFTQQLRLNKCVLMKDDPASTVDGGRGATSNVGACVDAEVTFVSNVCAEAKTSTEKKLRPARLPVKIVMHPMVAL